MKTQQRTMRALTLDALVLLAAVGTAPKKFQIMWQMDSAPATPAAPPAGANR